MSKKNKKSTKRAQHAFDVQSKCLSILASPDHGVCALSKPLPDIVHCNGQSAN